MSVSVVMCIRNEGARLERCLSHLGFADEVVAVLDRSTDESAAIAQRMGAHVIEGAWESEGERRNVGISAARNEWILELDADETIGPALAQEITGAIASGRADYFVIPFENWIGGRLVRYGWGAYNGVGSKACLFKKTAKIVGMERIYPTQTYHGREGRLTNTIHHDVYPDIAGIIAKLNRYSDQRAEQLADAGDAGSRGHAIRRVFTRFWKAYVSRKGYREGHYGFALALMAGLFPLLSHLKAQELLSRRVA